MSEINFIKCDGCGGYHPEDEIETVVIKLRKGKGCDIHGFSTKPKLDLPRVEVPLAPVSEQLPTNVSVNGQTVDITKLQQINAAERAKSNA